MTRRAGEPAPDEAGGAPGCGIFTTAGCDRGRPFLWSRHTRRLERSMAFLAPGARVQLPGEQEIVELLAAGRLVGPARLRLVVQCDTNSARWTVSTSCSAWPSCGPRLSPLHLSPIPRPVSAPPAGHKWLARDDLRVARDRAREAGADEALLVNAAGEILETSTANIFVRFDNLLVTPPAPQACLPGTVREWLLEHAPVAGLQVCERALHLDELAGADEVWATNALIGVRRVARVGNRSWDAWAAWERLRPIGVPAPGWKHG